MSKPKVIPLPEAASGEYDLLSVRADMDNNHGLVINQWDNRQLAGQVVVKWARESFTARSGYKNKRGQTILPLEAAIMQDRAIAGTAQLEIDDLAGTYDESGMFIPGSLDKLGDHRWTLMKWSHASDEEKEAAKEYFKGVEEQYASAVNPYKVIACDVAKRIKTLRDINARYNPQAKIKQVDQLERELDGRLKNVSAIKWKYVALDEIHSRMWRDDIEALGKVRERALTFRASEDPTDLQQLRIALKDIKSYVQPGNLFANELTRTHGRVEDPAVVERLLTGLDLVLFRHMMTRHAYKLNRMTGEDVSTDRVAKRMSEIEETMSTLESIGLDGPYRKLGGRILQSCETTVAYLHGRNFVEARKQSAMTATLLHEHCYPKEDAEIETWYRYKP